MTSKLILSICILSFLTACPALKDLNDRLERQMYNQHPGGAFGHGMDMFILSQQMNMMKGKYR